MPVHLHSPWKLHDSWSSWYLDDSQQWKTTYIGDMTNLHVWHDSFGWPINMCDVPHLYAWHDSIIAPARAAVRLHVLPERLCQFAVVHLAPNRCYEIGSQQWVRHESESFLWVTSHLCICHESCHAYEWVMSLLQIRVAKIGHENEVAYMNESCLCVMSHVWMRRESCHTYERVMSQVTRIQWVPIS